MKKYGTSFLLLGLCSMIGNPIYANEFETLKEIELRIQQRIDERRGNPHVQTEFKTSEEFAQNLNQRADEKRAEEEISRLKTGQEDAHQRLIDETDDALKQDKLDLAKLKEVEEKIAQALTELGSEPKYNDGKDAWEKHSIQLTDLKERQDRIAEKTKETAQKIKEEDAKIEKAMKSKSEKEIAEAQKILQKRRDDFSEQAKKISWELKDVGKESNNSAFQEKGNKALAAIREQRAEVDKKMDKLAETAKTIAENKAKAAEARAVAAKNIEDAKHVGYVQGPVPTPTNFTTASASGSTAGTITVPSQVPTAPSTTLTSTGANPTVAATPSSTKPDFKITDALAQITPPPASAKPSTPAAPTAPSVTQAAPPSAPTVGGSQPSQPKLAAEMDQDAVSTYNTKSMSNPVKGNRAVTSSGTVIEFDGKGWVMTNETVKINHSQQVKTSASLGTITTSPASPPPAYYQNYGPYYQPTCKNCRPPGG